MRDAHSSQARSVVACLTRFDGCHVDEQRARLHGPGNALIEQHVFHHRATFQHADHNVCVFSGLNSLQVNGGAQRTQTDCLVR